MTSYYRHKKGKIYRVLCEAKHSETCEPLIVYQAMYDKGEVWVRPKEMFFEEGRFERLKERDALDMIPIEFNPKYRFPDIEYKAEKVALIDNGSLSSNVKAMITLLTKMGKVNASLLKDMNDDDLEQLIIDRIKSYNPGDDLEEIFHLIQIWGGNSGRGIYVFDKGGFKWEEITSHYQRLVDACLSTHDINEASISNLVEIVKEFNKSVKNINVAFITKHTRYWLYRNLELNALPIYDSIMANYVMQKAIDIKDLQEYWKVMIAKANQLEIGLVPLERQIFKFAYERIS